MGNFFKNNRHRVQHQHRYMSQFLNNINDTEFWGIGIENETYIQGEPTYLHGTDIIDFLGRERYSIDYTKSYDITEIKNIMKQIFKPQQKYKISRMLNAHCFLKIDTNGEHKTTYDYNPKSNSRYLGKTIYESWTEFDEEIFEKIDSVSKNKTNIFFDGDTIEFITENFYKTTADKCVDELRQNRNWFLNKFEQFRHSIDLWKELGNLDFVKYHPGLNIFQTQKNKIVLFNNSTIHIHLTLPTKIIHGKIRNMDIFNNIHKKAISVIQWFEPFFISTLGSPDLFQVIHEKLNPEYMNTPFTNGSMRCALSRYIGIGTYTSTIKNGKIIQISLDKIKPTNSDIIWWRDTIQKDMNYIFNNDIIGLDFNINKHYQSGLEFRLLDGIPLDILYDVLNVLILICEHSLHISDISEACNTQLWNDLVVQSLKYGYKSTINSEQINEFINILQINLHTEIFMDDRITLEDFYYIILENLMSEYNKSNNIIHKMTPNFKSINRWENINKTQYFEHLQSLN